MIQTVNPATGKVEKIFEPLLPEEIEKKLQKASDAFIVWKKTSIIQRIALIKALAEHLQENKEKYARLATLEMGRPLKESLGEIEKSISLCNFYCKTGKKFLSNENIKTEASKSYVQY